MKQRPYRPSDLEQVIRVYRAAIHTLAGSFYSQEQLEAWAPTHQNASRWQERMAQVRTIVMEHDGVIAGFVSYDLRGHLDLLFTDPVFARRGVATQLCRAVETELCAAGAARIFTEASLAAREFFERRGFKMIAEEMAECRGQYLRRFAMEKNIETAELPRSLAQPAS